MGKVVSSSLRMTRKSQRKAFQDRRFYLAYFGLRVREVSSAREIGGGVDGMVGGMG